MMSFKNTYSLFQLNAQRKKTIVFVVIFLCLCSYMAMTVSRKDVINGLKYVTNTRTEDLKHTTNKVGGKGVLVFSYMRCGSTLVGDFYRNSPGIFYIFEPLISFLPYHYFTNDSVCRMRAADCEVLHNTTRIHDIISTINNFYACKIRDIPKAAIDRILMQNKSGVVWSDFGKCLNSSVNKINCFDHIEHACRAAEVKVMKVLRLSYFHMTSFLKSNPSLNIIFLIRDPRAILNSRISTDWFPVSEDNPAEVKSNVDSLCKKMKDDIRFYEQTEPIYRPRMQLLNTVEITRNEQEMMKLLYKYRHDYKMHKEDKKFLDVIFMKKREKRLFRDWRLTLKNEYKQYIEEKCLEVISYLNKSHEDPEPMKLA